MHKSYDQFSNESSFNCKEAACRRRLLRWAGHFLANTDDVEDACQEVCLRCLLGRRTFRQNAKASTWLYRILVNVCSNIWHRASKRPEVKASEVDELILLMAQEKAAQEQFALYADQQLTQERIQVTLAQLPESQRHLIE